MVSTDNVPSLREFAAQTAVSYPMLSDFATRNTAKAYGVLMEERGMASRATFVIDKEGVIQYIEEGNEAVGPTGALTACQRSKR